MLYKNLKPNKLFPVIVMRLLLDGIAGMKFLVEGNGRHTWAVLEAHFSFYTSLPSLMKKRKANKQRNLDFKEVYKNSIIIDYFCKKRSTFDKVKF